MDIFILTLAGLTSLSARLSHLLDNLAERAIRNVKVKHKISGQFKILSAAENFAILRSIIDTAIKNNQNVVGALSAIAAYKRD